MFRPQWQNTALRIVFTGAASTSILIVVLIFIFLFREALPFAFDPGIGELFAPRWSPTSMKEVMYGIWPLLTSSILVTVIATVISVPIGVVSAVYISEVASTGEREFFKPFIELLAGIPSVVIGFFGIMVLGPLIKNVFNVDSGQTALTGALLLALMASPTIISISEDAIRSVPRSYKEASLATGATKLQTIWRVTVPSSLSGIIAAVMLGMGRVIGETMTVLMVTGNAKHLTLNPLDPVRTMTAAIAAEMGEVARGGHHYRALFWIGIILLLLTFGLNMIAQQALKRFGARQ
ncbi:phosphate ABC transporter permease subunit PstC [candidate division WOR-3 bacterium]|uniref:Phosphate transport system permease protein n=1 Tax=candidate division WOR-3 bacterium TaxID=2052148 RepID=A0A9D5QCK3_UNCW3|nr:phosphate ABC transporter permease subunit PstC [candidate division WOR-3 bacterium]MBD3364137.1 phosphate ABC transporter permease subunit PstC [candidate division WOR-3 bacterium]